VEYAFASAPTDASALDSIQVPRLCEFAKMAREGTGILVYFCSPEINFMSMEPPGGSRKLPTVPSDTQHPRHDLDTDLPSNLIRRRPGFPSRNGDPLLFPQVVGEFSRPLPSRASSRDDRFQCRVFSFGKEWTMSRSQGLSGRPDPF